MAPSEEVKTDRVTTPTARTDSDPCTASAQAIHTVLFDCDGVLMDIVGERGGRFSPLIGGDGDDFEEMVGQAERPAQSHDRDLMDAVRGIVEHKGWQVDPEDLMKVHLDIELKEPGFEVVAELRRAGVSVWTATNQHQRRGDHMRETLGFDDLFDGGFYSWEMGVAKPYPGFFQHIVDTLGVPAGQLVFVDDKLPNVEAARHVGMRGVHWHFEEGGDVLRSHLAELGLPLGTSGTD